MATHSSVLAWRIPGTGELCGLPSMGSRRVGHNWSDLAAATAGDRWEGWGTPAARFHFLTSLQASWCHSATASGTLLLVNASSLLPCFWMFRSVQSCSGSMLQTLRFTETRSVLPVSIPLTAPDLELSKGPDCAWRSGCRFLSSVSSCFKRGSLCHIVAVCWFSAVSGDKESVHKMEDLDSIPGAGRSPGEGNGNPLEYQCLGSPMDRGAWRATVYGVAESGTRLSDTWDLVSLRVASIAQGDSGSPSVSCLLSHQPCHLC